MKRLLLLFLFIWPWPTTLYCADLVGPDQAAPHRGQFYALEGVAEADLTDCQWTCIPLSLQPTLHLALVYDDITKERHPALYFEAEKPGTYTLLFDVNIPGRYSWVLKEVKVGDVEPDDPDPPTPLSDWATWTKTTVETQVPVKDRAKYAGVLASSIEATAAASAGGAFANAREFREAMRAGNRQRLGEAAWRSWNETFDAALTQALNLSIQKGELDIDDEATIRRVYLEIAKGLREVK